MELSEALKANASVLEGLQERACDSEADFP